MFQSESIINNLLMEVDSLSNRIGNIKQAYFNTAHDGLRKRLFYENNKIFHVRLSLKCCNKLAEYSLS